MKAARLGAGENHWRSEYQHWQAVGEYEDVLGRLQVPVWKNRASCRANLAGKLRRPHWKAGAWSLECIAPASLAETALAPGATNEPECRSLRFLPVELCPLQFLRAQDYRYHPVMA